MRIAIVDTLGSPYDGSTPSKRCLGGSESAVVFVARELTKLGMNVDVYNDCEGLDAKPGSYDGVDYRPIFQMVAQSLRYDVVIVSRSTRPFADAGLIKFAGKKILWMHDTFCEGDAELESYVVNGLIDEVWTLSDWHTTYVSQATHGHRRMMEVLKRKMWVTRNGVNIYRDVDISKKNPNHFVFNAAVSKGMKTLLEDIWPRMPEQCMLTVIGGAYPLKQADVQNDALTELMKKHNGQNRVAFTGMISQKEVADVLADAAFMLYPQSFPETFGISTVESLAYGTPVISGRFGAMEETAIEDGSYLMDYPVDSNALYTFNKDVHVEAFVKLATDAWNNRYLWQQKAQAALKVREVCSWNKVALQWKQHLWKITGRYLQKDEFNKVQRINHRTHEIFNKRWSNPEEWGYYPESEKLIEVVVPFRNASQYLSRCIESIAAQNYENFRLHLINDASTDDSEEVIQEALSKFDIKHHTYCYLNKERIGALANQIKTIDYFDSDSIVMLIDGDDALINNPNVFKKINQLYHDGAEMTYGSMWSMADDIPLVAQEYPNEVYEKKSFGAHRFPWEIPYTHLRTFKAEVFHRCDHSSLLDSDGNYYMAAGDSALFYALINVCEASRVVAVKDVLYLYNDMNPDNDYKVNSKEQIKNTAEILNKATQLKSDGPKSILIAIPTAQNIHPETFKSIYNLKIPDGYVTYFQFFYGYCIDQVRNLIANFAINNNFDYLFCVDYDMSFNDDTIEKLLSHDKDIVSGLYIQRKPGQHILEVYRKNGDGAHYNVPMEALSKNTLEPIDGCGFGCVLIKTEVLKTIGYPQFTYHHAITIEDTLSEDVDFCMKAQAKGFELFADTSVTCRHHGQTIFEV